ncbi:MAG: hypothetical protein LKI53_09625 [Bacteroidales bacterium]|nr:hypothetical protein [Bacteroidales bacterium]
MEYLKSGVLRTLLLMSVCLVSSLFFVGCSGSKDEGGKTEEKQIALYDQNKEAIAYIDYEDTYDKESAIIYMYDGTPVAYIYEPGINGDADIYGFNGHFMGWYMNGVVYNNEYYAVGARHGILRGEINTNVTRAEKLKSVQKISPVMQARMVEPVRPVLKDVWSETSLSDFLLPSDD